MDNNSVNKELLEIEDELAKINKELRGKRYKREDLVDLEQLLIAKEYKLAKESLYAFLKLSWKLHESSEFLDGKHIEAICEHLEACYNGEIQNLIISVPPRSGKTTTVTIATPAWLWVQDPGLKIINCSYSHTLATKQAVASRNIIKSDWYQVGKAYWGIDFELSKDHNRKSDYSNTKGGERFCAGVDGTLTGVGCNWALVDDILNAVNANSEKERDNSNEFLSSLATRLNDQGKDKTIMIAQRLHEMDAIGYTLNLNDRLDEKRKYVHLNLPMLYDPKEHCSTRIGWEDWRTQKDEILIPNRYTHDDIDMLEVKLGPYAFAAQYQQNPAPIAGGMVKREWFHTYYVLPQWFDSVAVAFDLSMTDSETADETAAVAIGRSGGKFYVLEAIADKMDVWQQVELIKRMSEKYPLAAKLVEAKANGQAVISLLQNVIPGIIAIQPTEYGGNKEARLAACIPTMYSKSVYLPDESRALWLKKLIDQLLWFPKAKRDDLTDAFCYALLYLSLKCKTIKMPTELTALKVSNTNSREYILEAFNDNVYRVNTSNKLIRGYFS